MKRGNLFDRVTAPVDTIFAVASGPPPAAIAVMRISGPLALVAAQKLAGTLPPPRRAAVRALRDPATGSLLDSALVLAFPGPGSATGEDCAELHLHGGRAVVAATGAALAAMPGLRAAEPGEFTRRSLYNGRIDLAQAEGLGDLMMAQTETQRRAALMAVEGAVGRAVAGWSARLLAASALVEAGLDFSDEDDVSPESVLQLAMVLGELADDMHAVVAAPPVERLHDGIRLVLSGPPNSGKSTLLNHLCARDAAIVSDIAGTTRDQIEVPVVRRGIAYILTDTAGLAAHTDDRIEAVGIERARKALEAADILLWLGDEEAPRHDALWLFPRCDIRAAARSPGRLAVSAATGTGIEALWAAIEARAAALLPREDQLALNARQRALCAKSLAEIDQARAAGDPLLAGEHLRLARAALDEVSGVTDTEAMLDALFDRFCIGK